MINCKVCTHYHHQGNQHLCDVGVYEVQIAGKADVVITQQECGLFNSKPLDPIELIDDAIIKAKRGRPAKC